MFPSKARTSRVTIAISGEESALLRWFCCLAMLLSGSISQSVYADGVRVRVGRELLEATVAGSGLRVGTQAMSAGSVKVSSVSGSVRVDGAEYQRPVAVTANGSVRLNGRRYPGEFVIVAREGNRIDVINHVPLEDYVARSVSAEVYSGWPEEVLKAQAVLARTYALHERHRLSNKSFELEASTVSQAYSTAKVPASVRDATRKTRGEVLLHAGEPILAVYHSNAGGQTAASEEVWSSALPYLRPVLSPDDAAPDYFWSYEIQDHDLAEALYDAGLERRADADEVKILQRSDSGRVSRIRLLGIELSGRQLRQVLGGRAIRSALFDVRYEDGVVRFLGSGSGHGVGLSQWGARELARKGRNYKAILSHYYPQTKLRQVRELPPVSYGGSTAR